MEKLNAGAEYASIAKNTFVNMDETGVYFEEKMRSTVHARGDNTVHILLQGSRNNWMTACFSIAADGTRLPFLLIFKGTPGGHIARILKDTFILNFGIVEKNGWSDPRGMQMQIENIWEPYVCNHLSSVLLFDEISCHKRESILSTLYSVETNQELIPCIYTCVLQPCDAGVMRPFEYGVLSKWGALTSKNYFNLSPDANLVPSRKYISGWVQDSWNKVSGDMTRKAFNHIGLLENRSMPSSVTHFDNQFTNGGNNGTDYDVNVDDGDTWCSCTTLLHYLLVCTTGGHNWGICS